jgi:hypothetical protein
VSQGYWLVRALVEFVSASVSQMSRSVSLPVRWACVSVSEFVRQVCL